MIPAQPPKLKWPWIKIQVNRYVYTDRGFLVIQLGRFWEICVTREMTEEFIKGLPLNTANLRLISKDRGFIKRIKEFSIIPFWYGWVGRDFERDISMYAPIPLNYIWCVLRWLKWKLLLNIKRPPAWMCKHELEIYRLGQQNGYEKGRYNRDVVRGAAEILRAEGLDARYKE